MVGGLELSDPQEPGGNARDLHEFLKIGRVFGVEIAERVEGIEFFKDQDFGVFQELRKNPKGGRPRKEYLLSMDKAKELLFGATLIASGDRRAVWVCRGIRLQGRQGAHRDLSRSASAARGTHPVGHQLSSGARVNVRDLYAFLGSKQDFSDWFKNRIKEFDFVENEDFGVYHKIMVNPSGGRPTKEYWLTMDAAKEFSMLERNEKGKQARRYFIECEKRLRNMLTVPALDFSDPLTAAKLYIRVCALPTLK